MATLFDQASLVMIPSGFKDDKLYSIKPNDGSGDFTFSRDGSGASVATRVDASGNIEKGRTNELLQSNTFDTTWTLNNAAVTGGHSGYDGTNDAWELQATSTSSARVQQFESNTGVQSLSIYAKANTADFLVLEKAGTNGFYVYFDISTGSIGNSSGNIDASITSVGGGWYRCEASGNPSASTKSQFYVCDANGSTAVTNGATIYIQDAQLQKGLVSTTYIETTTTTQSRGLLGDMPRLDYSGGATCPSLLLEPSRTNLNGISEYYNGWTKVANGTGSLPVVTSNTTDTLSPEGVYNASKIVFNSGAGTTSSDESSLRYTNTGLSVSSQYTNSIWLKGASGGEEVILRSVSGTYGKFTLTTEWQRFEHIETCTLSSFSTSLGIRQDAGFGTINSSATVYAYGFQLELGSYPTSYIPTYGSATARAVDFASDSDLVGTDIAFGANDDFTLFYEGSFNDLSSTSNMIMGGGRQQLGASYKNYWWVQNATSMRITGEAEVRLATTSMSLSDNTNHKILVKRSGSVVDFFVDGSKLTTTQNTPNTAFTFRSLGWAYSNSVYKVSGNIKQAIVFESALTDAECIALTTL